MHLESRQVLENILIVLVSLEIVTGYEIFNPLLDSFNIRLNVFKEVWETDRMRANNSFISFNGFKLLIPAPDTLFETWNKNKCKNMHLKHAAQLLNAFHNQLLMTQDFPTLHDTHNCSINSISPIFVNILNYLLPFIHRWKRNLERRFLKVHLNNRGEKKQQVKQ